MNYYNRPEVSNSDLSALARAFNALPDNRDELEDVFNFGILVDCFLTERHKIDFLMLTVREDGGNVIQYTSDVFYQGQAMAEQAKRDPVLALLIKNMVGQYVFARTLKFSYSAEDYEIKARCKFDLFSKPLQTGGEFKTTACTTQKQFREAVEHFHWDRAAAWYMDLARIDRHWIVGKSKKTDAVFKIAVQRGDPLYELGRKKYSFWAYQWITKVEPFAQLLKSAA